MSNYDAQEVLRHIQIILSSEGLTPCQLREKIGDLINDELNNGTLVCDKAWQKCESKVSTIYPLTPWTHQLPVGNCAIHGGIFVKPVPSSTVA